ncbi:MULTISPECIES: hypothetical protein [Microcoleus]|uniref:Uncharacterized protein n=1 Tax=Microcoleus asticus IPMA8 TaxID=2563858 RepID=A0ABX2CWI8_9CYAN|nr:hypothetical protein [Microcoleus asticus]NQE34293.1 hypothetical protein [Microcoleus asticus IPMA8]
MFNHEYKKEAQDRLRRAVEKYQRDCEYLQNAAGSLYQTRVNRGVEIIQLCENYINTLANSPKEFSKVVTKLKFQLKEITGKDWDLIYSAHNSNVAAAGGAGVMAGAGVACFGPAAAMAIATTFGTASTGTAIASLSGAAAVNAALAWLGGGALTVGGGGMVAGNALLALAGPIGWGIGGVALAGSAFWTSSENEKIGREATNRALEIEGDTAKVNITKKEVNLLEGETVKLANFIQSELQYFKQNAALNYLNFRSSLKQRLATLINSIEALSQSLKKTVDLKL